MVNELINVFVTKQGSASKTPTAFVVQASPRHRRAPWILPPQFCSADGRLKPGTARVSLSFGAYPLTICRCFALPGAASGLTAAQRRIFRACRTAVDT